MKMKEIGRGEYVPSTPMDPPMLILYGGKHSKQISRTLSYDGPSQSDCLSHAVARWYKANTSVFCFVLHLGFGHAVSHKSSKMVR